MTSAFAQRVVTMTKHFLLAGSQNGQRMRAKGHGLLNKAGERGFLYIQLKAVMPKQADDETIALWQELEKKAAFNPREHF